MIRAYVPGTTTALLSKPSKMPGYAWGIPAKRACPRSNGTICEDCYAVSGFYRMPTVIQAQETRFAWVRECMRTDIGKHEFSGVMWDAIRRACKKQPYFRIHDSGDFFSPAYTETWLWVCAGLPEVKFWAPTRAWQIPDKSRSGFHVVSDSDKVMYWLRQLAKLPNVTVRPSALNFGDPAPIVSGLQAGSTSDYKRAMQCPARQQGNQCGECRACWEDKEKPISYAKH